MKETPPMPTEVLAPSSALREGVLRLARFIRRTARVHPLELGDFLVVNRDGRAAVALFTDEVVTGGGDVTAQARHALEIDHLVPPGLDPRGGGRRGGRKGGGQLQREEIPPARLGEIFLWVLHPCLTPHQLPKRPARGIRVCRP